MVLHHAILLELHVATREHHAAFPLFRKRLGTIATSHSNWPGHCEGLILFKTLFIYNSHSLRSRAHTYDVIHDNGLIVPRGHPWLINYVSKS